MIDVITFVRGTRRDSAEAADPESAVVAARTLARDYTDHGGSYRFVTVGFYVNDQLVRMLDATDLAAV